MRRTVKTLLALVGVGVLVACASAPSQSGEAPLQINSSDPLAATLLMQQGQALVDQGQYPQGIAKIQEAVKLQPDNPTVHNQLGRAELAAGEATKALGEFNKALDLAPSYSDARNNRGSAYVYLGQYSLAEQDFLTVLGDTTFPNRAGVYFNLGSLYYGRGNLAAAEENLRKAATAAGPVEAYVLLGKVETQLGHEELAEKAYREAMRRAPERPDVPLALAVMLEKQGRGNEAQKLFEQVISLAPGSKAAQEARTHLRR